MIAYFIGIALSTFLGYTLIAGTVYAMLPHGFGEQPYDRGVCAWGWPVFVLALAIQRLALAGYGATRAVFLLPSRRERTALPEARSVHRD